jgi:hypothetical protein
MNNLAVARNVSMYPEQWDLVDRVDAYNGFRNTSTALRYIIEQYRRLAERDDSVLQKERLSQVARDFGFDTIEEFQAAVRQGQLVLQ